MPCRACCMFRQFSVTHQTTRPRECKNGPWESVSLDSWLLCYLRQDLALGQVGTVGGPRSIDLRPDSDGCIGVRNEVGQRIVLILPGRQEVVDPV